MDPFAGSGTTLEAADELGYRAVGVDLDDSHFEP
jgi:tRNA G10  N-methylase Trm11